MSQHHLRDPRGSGTRRPPIPEAAYRTNSTYRASDAQVSADELLVAAATGDERAFDLFCTQVAGMAFGVVQVILRDADEAEDVTREALLDVWRTAGRYSSDTCDAVTWVMAIAHHHAVNRMRQERTTTCRDTAAAGVRPRSPSDNLAEPVIERAPGQQVRSGLAELTNLQREAIMLAYYRGMTCRDIGDALHIPPSTVKTQLRDGLIRLRDLLSILD